MRVKTPHAENPRFPAPRQSTQGKSVPKARQKCVVDGKQVNIPAPSITVMGRRRRLNHPEIGCSGTSV